MSAADLRLLCSGQFLDNAKTLKGVVGLLQQQSGVSISAQQIHISCLQVTSCSNTCHLQLLGVTAVLQ